MKYALQDLVRIRVWREEKAQREVTRRQFALDQALLLAARRRRELEDYTRWRLQTEDRQFREIQGRFVRPNDLDAVNLKVTLMAEEELNHVKAMKEAEEAASAAARELEEARNLYRLAVQEKLKTEEHRRIWMAEAMRKEEQEGEKEFEDVFPGSLRSDADWVTEDEDF